MKTIQYIAGAMLWSALLISCDNTSTTERTPNEIAAADQLEVQEEMEQEQVQNLGANEEEADVTKYEIVGQNLQFSPSELKVKPGERIQVILLNRGDVPYSLKFELPDGEQELRTEVPPGRRAGLIFMAPQKAGTYPFYSPLQNHRGRGMVGTLVVE
ncbi:cupredoxin domain-containing protein [Cesiribacter sp. SM1]|uniref:cupredoxin domain-containing protein n=1 Tax=Cesiribacter sp. SM1 TaxID=2861196 RepID=UPI001CD7FAF8|nr:cupredoxin domain-containing protein [Cesiribacter sp. SM1]